MMAGSMTALFTFAVSRRYTISAPSSRPSHPAARKVSRSAPRRPITCTPTGMPAGPLNAGTLIAGTPIYVHNRQNFGLPVVLRSFGASPAVTGAMAASKSPMTAVNAMRMLCNASTRER